jgi:predicted transcriptional regulator
MLRILERKGYLRHKQEGRAFVYEPVVPREAACRNEVANMVRRFFNNSPELLVLNILEQEKIDAKELQRIRRLILENKPKEEKT